MRSLGPQLLLVLLAFASTDAAAQKVPGTISGRVTAGGQPAANVEVLLKQGGDPTPTDILQLKPPTTTTTDSEGRYRLTSVAPGSYRVSAYAPAFVIDGPKDAFSAGTIVNVGEGEAVENVNISMTLGCVLTGTVTDQNEQPLIGLLVTAHRLQPDGKLSPPGLADMLGQWQSDDRGIYRIFGLEPGRYVIAAGASTEALAALMSPSGNYFKRTFHPDALEMKDAKIIELKSGDVVENVDIKLAPTGDNKFIASGRVIEADSGKPVVGVIVAYVPTKNASTMSMGSATNAQGEFRLEGLTSNTYRAWVLGLDGASENYAVATEFAINGADVSGLEIKMLPGVSLSGTAVFEGSTDPKLLEKLTGVLVAVDQSSAVNRSDSMTAVKPPTQIDANGRFRIGGLRPGKTRLSALVLNSTSISLLRVEHNGIEVKEFLLTAGENVTGVRLVFGQGVGSVAGKLEVRGGTLPANLKLSVSAMREPVGPGSHMKMVDVDARGQFLIEGLMQGSYRLRLHSGDSSPRISLPNVEQSIVVAGNVQQQVILVLDLAKKVAK